MLVPWRKSPSHALLKELLKELLFSGEIKHLFGEKTMHYTSPRSRGDFRAEIVSYDGNQNCLVSSLSFHATTSRNGTTVTCTNRDRSSNQSLSLHIMSECTLLIGFYVAEMYTWNRGEY